MKSRFAIFSALLLVAAAPLSHAALPETIDGEPVPSLAPLVKRVAPAVVNIRVSQTVEGRSPYADEMFRLLMGQPVQPRREWSSPDMVTTRVDSIGLPPPSVTLPATQPPSRSCN